MDVTRKQYAGLDIGRLACALLVVAIHTSPLYSLSPMADFWLTRVLARVAVPFFFMCTGFFTLGAKPTKVKLWRFTKKTLALYLISVCLYLPLNLYNGYFTNAAAFQWLASLLWNGTFYHLWYFPAVLWGVWLVYGLQRLYGKLAANVPASLKQTANANIGFTPVLLATTLLYLAGLLGNTYGSLFPGIYTALHQLFPTTRNGLFLAPLFLVLGSMLAAKPQQKRQNPLWLALLLGAFTVEWLLLYTLPTLKGDVFYIVLPFFTFALFRQLAGIHIEKGTATLRSLSQWVYVLHPWCIAVLRPVLVYISGNSQFMLTHSLVFFLLVAAASLFSAFCLTLLTTRGLFTRATASPRAVATISTQALTHNLLALQQLLPENAKIMAVVKANAYGHGAVPVARHLYKQGVRYFAVATLQEGIALRKHGLRGEILVLGYVPAADAKLLCLWCLQAAVVDLAHAHSLSATGRPLRVHVKLDTGMHRHGIQPSEAAEVYALPYLKIEGLFTHLCCADSPTSNDIAFTQKQIALFYQTARQLENKGIHPGKLHLQASHGLINYPAPGCSYARAGLALYGALEEESILPSAKAPTLLPVLTLQAPVSSIRTLPPGQPLGYGCSFTSETQRTVATVALGYADGLPRTLHNAHVLVQGKPAPIIGRVCMDCVHIDITGLPSVQQGEMVTFIGENLPVTHLASASGSIPNEILARLGPRIERRYT